MKKSLKTAALLMVLLAVLTGCTANIAEEASPSPTVSQEPSASPAPSAVASPKASAATEPQTMVFKSVGDAAEITVGTTKIRAGAYYTGESEDTMVFPVGEVAKALGWSVSDPDAAGPVEVKLTQDGTDEVIIAYTKPEDDKDSPITPTSVTKGGKDVDVGKNPLAFIDGLLYGTEVFFDKTLQEIDVKYDGGMKITIETKV